MKDSSLMFLIGVRHILVMFLLLVGQMLGQNNYAVLHRFHLNDGAGPQGALVADSQENLYGVTFAGGSGACTYNKLPSGCGTVFELTPLPGGGWSQQTLYTFQGGGDGAFPMAGLAFDQTGNLYGTTSVGGISGCGFGVDAGCGTVFELSPPLQQGGPWTETVLYRFTNGDDGSSPEGSLILDIAGNLYGTSLDGTLGYGAIFELAPSSGGSWVENTLHDFDPSSGDGGIPSGGLLFDAIGNLYGATQIGGGTGCGPQGLGLCSSFLREAASGSRPFFMPLTGSMGEPRAET